MLQKLPVFNYAVLVFLVQLMIKLLIQSDLSIFLDELLSLFHPPAMSRSKVIEFLRSQKSSPTKSANHPPYGSRDVLVWIFVNYIQKQNIFF